MRPTRRLDVLAGRDRFGPILPNAGITVRRKRPFKSIARKLGWLHRNHCPVPRNLLVPSNRERWGERPNTLAVPRKLFGSDLRQGARFAGGVVVDRRVHR